MATYDELMRALENADAAAEAGDEDAANDARELAAMIKRGQYDDAQSEKPYEEMGAVDTARGALEAFNKGTTLGHGDEVVGFWRTLGDYAMDKLIDNPLADDPDVVQNEQSFMDRWNMYTDDQRDVGEAFADEHGKTALALQLAGGLMSPANFVGPGLQAAKGAGALKAAGQLGARGAVEGAIAGVGEADTMDDAGLKAARGALIGGGLSGTMGGVGRFLTKRNIDQELLPDEIIEAARELRKSGDRAGAEKLLADNFMPLHLVDDDTILTDAAREGLGRVAGAASKLRNQERRFIDAAEEGVEAAQRQVDDLSKGVGGIGDIELDVMRRQARESLPEQADDIKGFENLWDELGEATDPRAVGNRLKDYWDNHAFKEIKGLDFEVDDDLVQLLKRHFDPDDVDKLLQDTITGDRLLDIRNGFAIKANTKAGMGSGEMRQFAKSFDRWMKNSPDMPKNYYSRYKDELTKYGNFKAFENTLDKSTRGRFNTRALAKAGKKKYRAYGKGRGQEIAEDANDAIAAMKESNKEGLKQAKERLSHLRGLSAPKASGLSELFTTRAVGGALDLGIRGATLPMGLGAGQLLASRAGQRALAGQTGWQKMMQDDEVARLIAQLLRQTSSRYMAGE